ncbi:MAG: restriction endonuclease [Chloroflexi bacterium]|nr:restriction endonuclease [Chloroflexota bacterium]
MRQIDLREYQSSLPTPLSADEIVGLRRLAPQVRVEPSTIAPGQYELTPNSHVGIVRIGDTVFEIRPKLPIERFFFLLSYAVDPSLWQEELVPFDAQDAVLEAVAPAFRQLVTRATCRGLLHGYRTEEEALPLVRGQIRFQDQMHRRYGMALPVELRFDDFTPDINENRILLAALHRLSRLPIRSAAVRRGLHEVVAAFHAVSLVRFECNDIPPMLFTRLNQNYEPAIRLATLILKWASLELGSHNITGTSFLVDMNEVFELFVHRALREALKLPEVEFPRGKGSLYLDEARRVELMPDLSWRRGPRCCFVGDVKYKRVNVPGVKHPDLYQILAYLTATNLQAGLLVYAAGEGPAARHEVKHTGRTLIVESLDLEGSPSQILQQVRGLAALIRELYAVATRAG